MKKFLFITLLCSTITWSQKKDSIISLLKNEDLKIEFQNYLNLEEKIINFFATNSKPNNAEFIDITNQENVTYYDSIINKVKKLNQAKSYFRNNFYDLKYKEDKNFIYERLRKADSTINSLYISRFKIVKTRFKNVKSAEDVEVLPKEVCERLSTENEFLQPTHDTCKNLGLSNNDEVICFANFLRNNVASHIQKYMYEFEDDYYNISTMIQFVIDFEGNLIFDKFTRSSGKLKYDLAVYKGFRSFANVAKFCPAKQKDKSVSIYYNLPIKLVMME